MNIDFFHSCAACKVCEGAGYQMVPLLYAGNQNAKIVAIAQNPGEMKVEAQITFMNAVTPLIGDTTVESGTLGRVLYNIYCLDVKESHMNTRMSEAFGNDWMTEMMYTNAVRCRTKKNASPSVEMVNSCAVWTRKLVERQDAKALILLGSVARRQLFAADEDKLTFFSLKRNGPSGRLILTLPHPTAWKPDDIKTIQGLYKRLKEALDGTHN